MKRTNVCGACIMVAVVLLQGFFMQDAAAKSSFVKKIPNGKKMGCAQCHADGNYKEDGFTAFGSDFKKNGLEWNTALAKKDSDGDGKTNGQELGDPSGSWKKGDADPSGNITNPGDATSK